MKRLFLFLLLLLPVLAYLFLQEFGRNEYNIPVFYTEGVKNNPCVNETDKPYLLNDSVRVKLNVKDKIFLVITDTSKSVGVALDEVKKKLAAKLCRYFFIHDLTLPEQQHLLCLLMMQENTNAVLIDKVGRIRGYYNLLQKKELDRVESEISILFTKKK